MLRVQNNILQRLPTVDGGSSFHYSRGGGGYQLQGELASGGLLSYQANEQLGQGQAHR